MNETKTDFVVHFDQTNINWSPDSVQNALFLRSVRSYVNNLLMLHGFVFVNDVLKSLGISITSQGQIYGWFWEEGSNTIEFDITEVEDGSITIKLNPDGEIWERLP